MQVQLARAGLLARVALRVLEALRLLQVLPVRPAVERDLHRMRATPRVMIGQKHTAAT